MRVSAGPMLADAAGDRSGFDVDAVKGLALCGAQTIGETSDDVALRPLIVEGLRIRAVENELLALFGRGKLHGTIHTCVGQELSGAIIGSQLRDGDFVTSNHRCHGHFIAATKDWRGLIDEIVGNHKGVSAGVGSSQHLYAPNFISNGLQGGLLPVAAGVALDRKRRQTGNVAISFIGEGTLGEGVLYETLNLDSLFGLPHLIVCENNFYSQSTPQPEAVAGDIVARAAAFGLAVAEVDTWNPAHFMRQVSALLEMVRKTSRPAFLLVKTYRLNAHSKGDDPREVEEVGWFRRQDPLNILIEQSNWAQDVFDTFSAEVRDYIDDAMATTTLPPDQYFYDQLPVFPPTVQWALVEKQGEGRFHQKLNTFYLDFMREHGNGWFIGEDIADPYGGAFKISRGITSEFGDRALTTPISEAGIAGLGVGLAIAGNRPLVEIMFGDFMTLVVDQIINNASKFFHMYNRRVSCPVVLRSPMGGRRGYGPTHSQSLERLFVGIDNCLALSLNSLVDPALQLCALSHQQAPTVLFENKVDYTVRPFAVPAGFVLESNGAGFPTLRLRPTNAQPTATLFCYGGMARFMADGIMTLFEMADVLAEMIVPTALHPLDITPIVQSAEATGLLIVIEEGPGFASVGAEVVAVVMERVRRHVRVLRVGKHPMPIPSVPALEDIALPSLARVCHEIRILLGMVDYAAR